MILANAIVKLRHQVDVGIREHHVLGISRGCDAFFQDIEQERQFSGYTERRNIQDRTLQVIGCLEHGWHCIPVFRELD